MSTRWSSPSRVVAALIAAALVEVLALATCSAPVDPVALCKSLWDRNMLCLDPDVFGRPVPEVEPDDESASGEMCLDPRLQEEAAWSAGCVDLTDCDEFLACFRERTPLEEVRDLLQKAANR